MGDKANLGSASGSAERRGLSVSASLVSDERQSRRSLAEGSLTNSAVTDSQKSTDPRQRPNEAGGLVPQSRPQELDKNTATTNAKPPAKEGKETETPSNSFTETQKTDTPGNPFSSPTSIKSDAKRTISGAVPTARTGVAGKSGIPSNSLIPVPVPGGKPTPMPLQSQDQTQNSLAENSFSSTQEQTVPFLKPQQTPSTTTANENDTISNDKTQQLSAGNGEEEQKAPNPQQTDGEQSQLGEVPMKGLPPTLGKKPAAVVRTNFAVPQKRTIPGANPAVRKPPTLNPMTNLTQSTDGGAGPNI